MSGRIFLGGVPTAPDVARLMDRFGSPAVGTVITYDEIAAVIGSKYGTSRFESVLQSWRTKLLSEHNIELGRVEGESVMVLNPAERVDSSTRIFTRGARHIGRARRRAVMIRADECDDITRHKLEHLKRVTDAAAKAVGSHVKDLANALKAPTQLPKALPGS